MDGDGGDGGDSFVTVVLPPLLIAFEFSVDNSVDVCVGVALNERRFTSTKIGSSARKNSLTASSCAKLLTSFPFTYNKWTHTQING